MRSPVGSWLARVEKPSGTAEVGIHFTFHGLAFLVAEGRGNGNGRGNGGYGNGRGNGGYGNGNGNGGNGNGTWERQGEGIVYRIREAMIGDHGDYLGYIDISQRGTVTADRLESSGESQVYGPDGTLIRTVSVRITAVPRSQAVP